MLSFIASLLVVGCGVDVSTSHEPVFTFETTFGHKPSTGITALQGEAHSFRDSGHAYLRFNCTKADLVALLGTNFMSTTSAVFAEQTVSGSIVGPVPTWWTPLPSSTDFWQSGTFHPTFSQGKALAAFDSTTSIAHVYWDGSD